MSCHYFVPVAAGQPLRTCLNTVAIVRGGHGPGGARYNHAVPAVTTNVGWVEDSKKKRLLRQRLLDWYDRSGRDLPWRRHRDPYRVWVSEIMLQQTRVAAVLAHYRRFLQRYPTVQKLAAAREPSVLAAWSGLGYYRRARMLHAAAKRVSKEFAGELPRTAKELRGLPGIGRYTAAAIASIAHGQAIAVVDGNVERVLSRLLGRRLGEEEAWQSAETLLDPARPGDFNQAMMELGATICRPRQPACRTCPVRPWCRTRGELKKLEKGAPQIQREIHYALDCRRSGSVFLVQRAKDESLMPGMWELPEMAGSEIPHAHRLTRNDPGNEVVLRLRHSITVTQYAVRVSHIAAPAGIAGKWVVKNRIESLPLTGLARKILRAAKVI